MKNTRHFVTVSVLVLISTIVLYLLFNYVLFVRPLPASAEADPIDRLFNLHFWLIAFLFSLIMVIMLYAARTFRRQPGDETDGPHIHGHTGLEVGWTIVPTLIVVAVGIYAAVILNQLIAPKPNEVPIRVQAQQWSWSFQYPEQADVTSPELVLLVNQPVVLEMYSLDVLHSFWVPEFRVKQDILPGEQNIRLLRFTPTAVGNYKLRCAEICGSRHANMLADVRVLDETDYVAWVEDISTRPTYADLTPEERGEIWYGSGGYACNACHSLDGTIIVGPTWDGLFGSERPLADGTTVTADEAYIHESIVDPNAEIVAGFAPNIMPQNFEERFAEQEAEILANEGVEIDIVEDLIEFIKTIE